MSKKIDKWIEKNFNANLENKTILITGANSGIGFEVAKYCALFKAKVIMAVRNIKRGENAKNKLLELYPDADICLMQLDLASFDSIKKFTNEIIVNNIDIDVFYNNAGILNMPNQKTQDGFELVMGTNFIGTYFLNELLLEYFKSLNHEVKVILTSSIAMYFANIKYDDFFLEKKYKSFKIYANSKLAVTHYFIHLKQLYNNTNLKILLVHPGITYTPLISKAFGKVISYLANIFLKLFTHSVTKASLSTLYLLNDNIENGSFSGPRGLFKIAGYPKLNKLSKKVKRDYQKTIELASNLIKNK